MGHRKNCLVAAFALAGAIAAAAAAIVLVAGPARAAGEGPRWRFERIGGYLYRLGGPQATKILPDERAERTLYAADIRDGRRLACPPGRVSDLIFEYAFRLPDGPVEAGAAWSVDETHAGMPAGPIAAKGEGRLAGKGGGSWRFDWTVALEPAPKAEGRFERGRLTVSSTFHEKRGAVVAASFALEFSEKDGQASKPTSWKGTLEIARPLPHDPREVEAQAEKAIARGVEILKTALKKAEHRRSAHPLGVLAITLYALAKAGVEEGDPVLAEGFREFDRYPPLAEGNDPPAETYSVALAILAIEAKSARRLPPAKGGGGTSLRFEKGEPSRADLARIEKLARWLIDGRQPGKGVWAYRSWKENLEGQRGDFSLTQFAALALHAASRAGVAVPDEVFREIAGAFTRHQEKEGAVVEPVLALEPGAGVLERMRGESRLRAEGPKVPPRRARGWNYLARIGHKDPYSSMTAAGVSSLFICWDELERSGGLDATLAASIERAARDGLAWLEARHSMRANWPERDFMPLYHLYSLEKAFTLGGIAKIGGHDWWAEGAQEILLRERQGMPGGWGETWDTAFALLFLTRATREPELNVRAVGREASGGAAADDEHAVVVEGVGLVSAKDALVATEARDPEKRRERLDIAERAFRALGDEKRPALAPELARLLESAYPECVRLAAKLLQEVAGERLKDRAAALAFHERWLAVTKDGLAGDPAAIPRVRERLRDALPGVRRAAALALARLNAVEAAPELIDALERDAKIDAAYLAQILAGLLGRDATARSPEGGRAAAAERWRKVWAEVKDALLAREEVRRAVRDLAHADRVEAARAKILAAGKAAARPLIDALSDDAARYEAVGLLVEITGRALGVEREAWEEWWRTEGLSWSRK